MSGPKTSPTKQPPPLILNTLPSKQHAQRKFRCADLVNNPYNSRLIYTPETIAERAASIKQSGLLTPILVTSRNGQLIVANGWTRKLSFDLLNQESPGEFDVIPGEFRADMTDAELYEASYVTNEEHKLLTDYERAKHFKRGLDSRLYDSPEQLASRLLVDRTVVIKLMAMANLPEKIDSLLRDYAQQIGYTIIHEVLRLDAIEHTDLICKLLEDYATKKKSRAWLATQVDKQLIKSDKSQKIGPTIVDKSGGQIKWTPESKSRSIELTAKNKDVQRDAVALLEYLFDLEDSERKALISQILSKN
jgi:ParB/RepB/Spo0J family partition protein